MLLLYIEKQDRLPLQEGNQKNKYKTNNILKGLTQPPALFSGSSHPTLRDVGMEDMEGILFRELRSWDKVILD